MLDIGWSELVLIGVVALIVVGPKDLPQMFRTLGRFTAKARSMAREFSTAMESAARESGLDEATKDLRSMTSKKALGLDALETAATKFEAWKPNLTTPAATATAAATVAAAAPASETGGAEDTTPPRGPATQALADKLAAKAAERANPTAALIPDPDAAAPVAAASRMPKTRAPRTAPATAGATADAAAAPAARRRKTATAAAETAGGEAEPTPKTPRRKKTTT